LTGNEIRKKFLDFFAKREHKILPSASLIPTNDPSILWTAAGMVPFKPYFTGTAKPEYKRVTTCQKCLRTPDIESVGKTARHHTFFEMLGNFSFGDYFKDEAIAWAWEFVTKELGLSKDKLWISIYLDDDEAFEIWNKKIGIPADRIVRLGKDENFWEIGVGPCGPCSEIHYDLGEERGCGSPDCAVGCDCDRWLEIWNLVFIQFYKDEEGNYSPLKNKGIDTGMGLERIASVIQGVYSNFDTDIFCEIMEFTAKLLGIEGRKDKNADVALKVIADHCRAIVFAVADGALPSNEGRGYVIRRLLRRAVRFGKVLGVEKPFLHRVGEKIIRQMEGAYPELNKNEKHILEVLSKEEERFRHTLHQGTEILNRMIDNAKASGSMVIEGRDVFRLYDTYGFPMELTREIASEEGLEVDVDGFNAAMEEQRERARNARQEVKYLSESDALFKALREELGETVFVGYEQLAAGAKVRALLKDGQQEVSAEAGEEVEFVLDRTPCYAEAGGQVSDYALVEAPTGKVEVYEVVKPVENLYVHRGKVKDGIFRLNDDVHVEVDAVRRKRISRNHSCTHLLHKALKEVLGEHASQSGSLVEPERLRFDFTHYQAVSSEELRKVEKIVNDAILANLPIEAFETSLNRAKEMGAAALFGEKYGKRVRVVKMGDFSLELCGGTHLRSTAEIGLFKLVGESSIGAGLRRVEGVTGDAVLKYINAQEEQVKRIGSLVKAGSHDVVGRVESLLKRMRKLEEEVNVLKNKLVGYEVGELMQQMRSVNGIKLLAAKVKAPDMDSMRGMSDLLRERVKSGVILLGRTDEGKVNLLATVTRDLVANGIHAGKLVRDVARIVDGGGGGRPEMAQAGGKNPTRLQEALDSAIHILEKQIKN